MVYILTAQLYDDRVGPTAFQRYRDYLDDIGDRLPAGARQLATSDWYFDSSDHRAPHDAWLETATISEAPGDAEGRREVTLKLRLLGAYHDGYIDLTYRDVRRYRIDLQPSGTDIGRGHRDWRHDEFRLSGESRVEHEIEWWGSRETGAWVIEAADIEYNWSPQSDSGSSR
jgi:hypothetical protein